MLSEKGKVVEPTAEKLTALKNAEELRNADKSCDWDKFIELLDKDPDLIYYFLSGAKDYSWNYEIHYKVPDEKYFIVQDKIKKALDDNLDWIAHEEKLKKYKA